MDLEGQGQPKEATAERPTAVVSGAVRASPVPVDDESSQDDLEEIGVASAITFAVEPVSAASAPARAEEPLVERVGREVGEIIGLRLPGKKHPAAEGEARRIRLAMLALGELNHSHKPLFQIKF